MTAPFYKGEARKLSIAEFNALANEFGIETAALKAVTVVEARAAGFYKDGSVICLYEPHIAWKYADVPEPRGKLAKKGLAYAKWVAGNYPASSLGRIDEATKIANAELAAKATSWGLGQIMGFNHVAAGFPSALAMVKSFAVSEANQLRGMLNFIKANAAMMKALKAKDWAGFAKRYNGPGFAKNRYDVKLAQAYANASKGVKTKVTAVVDDIIDRGDKGPYVLDLQKKLNKLGFTIKLMDGDFGKITENAVYAWQKANSVELDGRMNLSDMAILNAQYEALMSGTPMKQVKPAEKPLVQTVVEKRADPGPDPVLTTATDAAKAATEEVIVKSFPGKEKDDLVSGDLLIKAPSIVVATEAKVDTPTVAPSVKEVTTTTVRIDPVKEQVSKGIEDLTDKVEKKANNAKLLLLLWKGLTAFFGLFIIKKKK